MISQLAVIGFTIPILPGFVEQKAKCSFKIYYSVGVFIDHTLVDSADCSQPTSHNVVGFSDIITDNKLQSFS